MTHHPYLSNEQRHLLERTVVGIAGAGGLGSNCAYHLVRAGIKHLVIADFDTVCESNLNRQFFFRDQIGKKKVDALRENLLRIEPNLCLEMHDQKITRKNILDLFSRCDFLAEGFDDADAKQMLLETILPLPQPFVVSVSGMAGWGESNAVRVQKIGKNLILIGDGHSEVNPTKGIYPSSPRVGIAAAMQANSILAILLGHPL